uniref:TSA: Wollemia nobilis Ref_Wollemi_Transcript_9416_1755 transcribed RNA sequence n=1 Tax=Wollemia nobilis TaxID=56998 RepID=A0A0C9RW97_9CONI
MAALGIPLRKFELPPILLLLVTHLLLACSRGDESAMRTWNDKLPGLTMPAQLAQLVSPFDFDQGAQAFVEDNSLCKSGRFLCEKSQISKLDPCVDRLPYKRRKLMDLVQDGFVGGCAQRTLPDDLDESAGQLHSNFFRLEEIATVGQKLLFPDFHENDVSQNVSFLPHKIAQKIPFNSHQLAFIVQAFSIPSTGSDLLIQKMATTLKVCEAPPSSIETKTCAISVESVAEFLSTVIGPSKVGVVDGIASSTRILSNRVVTVMGANLVASSAIKHVACHSMVFPSKVYYCHYVKDTNMYVVNLKDEKSGVSEKVVAECHMNTKPYPRESLALIELKIKPGEGEFCHWVPSDTLLFKEIF